ncbi:MAG: hypothetical protein AAB557_05285 [Patescibacteria group bacterium]
MHSKELSLSRHWRDKHNGRLPEPLPIDEQIRLLDITTGTILHLLYEYEDEHIPVGYWQLFGLRGTVLYGSYGRVPDPKFGPHGDAGEMIERFYDTGRSDIDIFFAGESPSCPNEIIMQFDDLLSEQLADQNLHHMVEFRDKILTPALLADVRDGRYWETQYGYRIITREVELLRMFDPSVCIS